MIMLIFQKILLTLAPLIALALVIYYLPAPTSWPEATAVQILAFFIPLLLFFTFLSNILFSYLPHAFIAGLGLMFLVVLYTAGQFNIFTSGIVIALIIISIKFFPRFRYKFRLTKTPKIHKITPLERKKS